MDRYGWNKMSGWDAENALIAEQEIQFTWA